MKFETKYNTGDKVYFLRDNQLNALSEGVIKCITITYGNAHVRSLEEIKQVIYKVNCYHLSEDKIFKDKYEVLQFLNRCCSKLTGEITLDEKQK